MAIFVETIRGAEQKLVIFDSKLLFFYQIILKF